MTHALPTEFEFGHDLSFVLHDMLAEFVVEGERLDLGRFDVPLRCPEDARAMEAIEGEELWRWLQTNGYEHVCEEHSHRELIFALLADMCQFIYEGLKCSEKGKLSVAFSNFRKPIQDNLYYLEWILADWSGFFEAFRKGPCHLDISKIKNDARRPRRLEVISGAMDQTIIGDFVDPEFLYELRYDKASKIGFDWVFNQALHLVTTHSKNATSPENLNFVFCDDDDRNNLWQFLYFRLPLILMHALYVVRSLFETFAPEFRPSDTIKDFWLLTGFLLWSEQQLGSDEPRDAAATMFKEALAEDPQLCEHCGTLLGFDYANIQRFWVEGSIRCTKCERLLPLLVPRHVEFGTPSSS